LEVNTVGKTTQTGQQMMVIGWNAVRSRGMLLNDKARTARRFGGWYNTIAMGSNNEKKDSHIGISVVRIADDITGCDHASSC
jgi:hypothetical protein